MAILRDVKSLAPVDFAFTAAGLIEAQLLHQATFYQKTCDELPESPDVRVVEQLRDGLWGFSEDIKRLMGVYMQALSKIEDLDNELTPLRDKITGILSQPLSSANVEPTPSDDDSLMKLVVETSDKTENVARMALDGVTTEAEEESADSLVVVEGEVETVSAAAVSEVEKPSAPQIEIICEVSIGQELYIRGSGPGMSWNLGTKLERTRTGFSWEIVSGAQWFEFKILLNDAIWCEGGNFAYVPGALAWFAPSFPALS